jgi:ketosteroid isomerase-like protein
MRCAAASLVVCSLVLAPLLSACGESRPVLDASTERSKLIAAELGFAHESVEKGAVEAFRDHLADDAVELLDHTDPIHGRDAIVRALESPPGSPKSTLEWSPEDGMVSGDLGYTWGHYTITTGAETKRGKYMTVWRRESDGTWKVIADMGNADPK